MNNVANDKFLWILVGANLAIGAILVFQGSLLGLINVGISIWIWCNNS